MSVSQTKWAHAANTPEALSSALSSPTTTAIESDIIFSVTKNQSVMGHPPLTDSQFTLTQYLSTLATNSRVNTITKLDFKSAMAFEAAIPALKESFCGGCSGGWPKDIVTKKHEVWLNADIVKGPGGSEPLFDATTFVKTALEVGNELADGFQLVLSVGWTTGGDERGKYSIEMVDELLCVLEAAKVHELGITVTFPIRAPSFLTSWNVLRKLLDINTTNTITLWWSAYEIEIAELEAIRDTAEAPFPNRTYYDVLGWEKLK
ncbi:hypothetical protein BCR33DRAFT_767009 [Rhizoclosmatium globosum]|uniref:Menorin-like domain-containing protein n=1 Tax=Rhizoclosmatium globosum TaxID=329046 RepID=A0A1Y2C6A1_9FUNG|nr:hypothetical protein BCR33DRAFT_767009 [Rhizoclosmatium globosum]|eukprot:ORY42568.1 hypothetical protein BCR33DRAFT_767009 [Rhizoclosmatium globosum]